MMDMGSGGMGGGKMDAKSAKSEALGELIRRLGEMVAEECIPKPEAEVKAVKVEAEPIETDEELSKALDLDEG